MHNKQLYFGEIISDKTSGSGEILKRFIAGMDVFLSEVKYTDRNEFFSLLNSIKKDMACFALIQHFTKNLILEIDKDKSRTSVNELAKKHIATYQRTWKNINENVAKQVLKSTNFKNKKVLLHSHSSFVLKTFSLLKKKGISVEVYQTMSSPANEGIIQAKKLAEYGFSVKIMNDAAVGRFFRDIDFCIAGADAIYNDCFINKTGTLSIGLLCKHFSKSLIVISDTRKFINEKCSPKMYCEPERPKDEVLKNPPQGVIPLNYYFERIPNNLVSKFIMEEDM